MYLKYIGRHTPIALMVKNKQGGMGITVGTGDTFECSQIEAADIISRFNKKGMAAMFVEGEAPKNAGKKGASDKNKMLKDMLKK